MQCECLYCQYPGTRPGYPGSRTAYWPVGGMRYPGTPDLPRAQLSRPRPDAGNWTSQPLRVDRP
eukprot:446234-Rhodomonas_salina.1